MFLLVVSGIKKELSCEGWFLFYFLFEQSPPYPSPVTAMYLVNKQGIVVTADVSHEQNGLLKKRQVF